MPHLYFSIFVAVAVLGLVGAFAVIIWLARSLPAGVEKKYPWTVRMKSKIPFFVGRWEKEIDPQDVPAFRRYRKVFIGWYVVVAVLLVLEIWIWQQMVHGI